MASVKAKFMKPYDFLCGIGIDVEENERVEVVHATLQKTNH